MDVVFVFFEEGICGVEVEMREREWVVGVRVVFWVEMFVFGCVWGGELELGWLYLFCGVCCGGCVVGDVVCLLWVFFLNDFFDVVFVFVIECCVCIFGILWRKWGLGERVW